VKKDATLTKIDIAQAGSGAFPSAADGHRCFIEWLPRADAAASDRRFFLGKTGKTDVTKILGQDGVKVPRAGKSFDPAGRTFVALAPGCIKLWVEGLNEADADSVRTAALPVTLLTPALVNSALITMGGAAMARQGSVSQIRGPGSSDSTPARRRHE